MLPTFPEQLVPSRSPPLVIFHMAMHLVCEGANIKFHRCFQSIIYHTNTVVPPLLEPDSNHSEQQWLLASVHAHTCMLICAPWVRSSSWHSAPWRDEEAKCRGEKPLSFSLKKKKKRIRNQLAAVSTEVLCQPTRPPTQTYLVDFGSGLNELTNYHVLSVVTGQMKRGVAISIDLIDLFKE